MYVTFQTATEGIILQVQLTTWWSWKMKGVLQNSSDAILKVSYRNVEHLLQNEIR